VPHRLSPERAFIGDGDDLKEQAHPSSAVPLASIVPTTLERKSSKSINDYGRKTWALYFC